MTTNWKVKKEGTKKKNHGNQKEIEHVATSFYNVKHSVKKGTFTLTSSTVISDLKSLITSQNEKYS